MITIKYESEMLLPEELRNNLKGLEFKILRDQFEADKINIHIARFKFDLVQWLSDHKTEEN
jgi:hypothetical protein